MKLTRKIIGLTLLLIVLWLFNSYRNGDFNTAESMAQMDARFPSNPETEYSDKKNELEIDLEKYEKTVNQANDTIRQRIQVQNHILDDTQVRLRPTYDEPRTSQSNNREPTNPPPVAKLPNAR